MATVKTYRALVALKVGPDDERFNGDLVPEAANWPNVDVYVRAGKIEVVWVDEAEVRKVLGKRPAPASSPTPAKKSAVKKPARKIARKTTKKEIENHGIIEEAV